MAALVTDEVGPLEYNGLKRKDLLDQLERIVTSSHFRNSKRYPSFLRFIVERTVEDNTEVLKERNLGTEVFGRPSDYDTNADPIVRVTAGEVRKRIAQYYQTAGHEHELRIDLPLGSYVPHFHAVAPAADPLEDIQHAPEPVASPPPAGLYPADSIVPAILPVRTATNPTARWRRWLSAAMMWQVVLYALAATGLGSLSVMAVNSLRGRAENFGTNYFWQAFTSGSDQALIVIGVHFIDSAGKSIPVQSRPSQTLGANQNALAWMENSDMVPVSDIVSYSKLTDLLTRRSLPYKTKSSVDTTLDEMRSGPVVLIGGFNNLWTMRLTSALRFRFVPTNSHLDSIQDSQHPESLWSFDNLQPALSNSRDYAIVASYYDKTIEQHVIIGAGIGMNGTIAASEFLSTERDMKDWLTEQKVPANKNLELVIETEVLDGQPGPPHVIASATW